MNECGKKRNAAQPLRMVIRNGFGRAMATIIDSHCTTLITGIVLFVIGTDQLRGFATTLVLGLLLNLFTAVYCSRIVFDVAERRRWFVHLRMMKLFGKTNFDFVKWMPRLMTISVALIVIGLGGAVAREMRLFNSAACSASTLPAARPYRWCSKNRPISRSCAKRFASCPTSP